MGERAKAGAVQLQCQRALDDKRAAGGAMRPGAGKFAGIGILGTLDQENVGVAGVGGADGDFLELPQHDSLRSERSVDAHRGSGSAEVLKTNDA